MIIVFCSESWRSRAITYLSWLTCFNNSVMVGSLNWLQRLTLNFFWWGRGPGIFLKYFYFHFCWRIKCIFDLSEAGIWPALQGIYFRVKPRNEDKDDFRIREAYFVLILWSVCLTLPGVRTLRRLPVLFDFYSDLNELHNFVALKFCQTTVKWKEKLRIYQ